jgi:hypothetical protein
MECLKKTALEKYAVRAELVLGVPTFAESL